MGLPIRAVSIYVIDKDIDIDSPRTNKRQFQLLQLASAPAGLTHRDATHRDATQRNVQVETPRGRALEYQRVCSRNGCRAKVLRRDCRVGLGLGLGGGWGKKRRRRVEWEGKRVFNDFYRYRNLYPTLSTPLLPLFPHIHLSQPLPPLPLHPSSQTLFSLSRTRNLA